MKTLRVFLDPALATKSADTKTKMAISMIPSTTPVRALSWIPEYTSHHRTSPQAIANTTHRYLKSEPMCRYVDRKTPP